ncbi:hypothetical protein BP6252_09405 [Coleophoma cylindrospora]|uniref:Uncharacterized protein n=1 Tax=Coleophoma cylindrospora TaxID=1849047 RepID=A0A3D8R1U0_9HELO|nr:hypothetical protein BP6252_09405 [Coleophoma cylindrospora]
MAVKPKISIPQSPSFEDLVPKSATDRRQIQLQKARAISASARTHESKRKHGKDQQPIRQRVSTEQKLSYGIGGAGNIRKPSEVIYPIRPTLSNSGPSNSTPEEHRRGGIMAFFSKRSTAALAVAS